MKTSYILNLMEGLFRAAKEKDTRDKDENVTISIPKGLATDCELTIKKIKDNAIDSVFGNL